MACEKRKANDEVELRRVLDQDGSGKASWIAFSRYKKEMLAIKDQIEIYTRNLKDNSLKSGFSKCDEAFLLYLHALICSKLEMKDNAISLLVDSINCDCFIWSAWYELVTLIEDKEKIANLDLPSVSKSWMRYFFEAKVS